MSGFRSTEKTKYVRTKFGDTARCHSHYRAFFPLKVHYRIKAIIYRSSGFLFDLLKVLERLVDRYQREFIDQSTCVITYRIKKSMESALNQRELWELLFHSLVIGA